MRQSTDHEQAEALKKKNKKAATKEKEESADPTDATATDANAAELADQEVKVDEVAEGSAVGASEDTAQDDSTRADRSESISTQSKLRSESFKNTGPLSPAGPSTAELEKENSALQQEVESLRARSEKLEEQLEESRAASADNAQLQQKVKEAEEAEQQITTLKNEIASLQRQNTQLQTAASRRKSSVSVPAAGNTKDLLAQIESKSQTIDSLELEVSKLNGQLTTLQESSSTQEARITELQSQLEKSEETAKSTAQELADLKANLAKSSQETEGADSVAKLAQLQAELGTAQRSADDATRRSETLEKKIEALTTLHKESETRSQSKITDLQRHEREAKDLRTRVGTLTNDVARLQDEAIRRKKAEATGEDGDVDDLEAEERARLQAQIRSLEKEVYDLRQGVWQDKRRELQLDMDTNEGFSDVDLMNSGTASPNGRRPTMGAQKHSTFADVINSGISAFTGQDNRRQSMVGKARPRNESIGLMSDTDFDFDPDAFAKAQEDVARDRIERVKAIKRGLTEWKGWRFDLVEVRSVAGPVYDV